MSCQDAFPAMGATVGHLRGLKQDLLVALQEERSALEAQLTIMREDLFAIMARLPGCDQELKDSEAGSRGSHGSMLSEQSGSELSEEFEDDELEPQELPPKSRKSAAKASLEGEFRTMANTCPDLGEFEDEGTHVLRERSKVVTCPTLEDLDMARMSMESARNSDRSNRLSEESASKPRKNAKAASSKTKPKSGRFEVRTLPASEGLQDSGKARDSDESHLPPLPFRRVQHKFTNLTDSCSTMTTGTSAQVGGASCSTDPARSSEAPTILQDLLSDVQQGYAERLQREREERLKQTMRSSSLTGSDSIMELPGQPEFEWESHRVSAGPSLGSVRGAAETAPQTGPGSPGSRLGGPKVGLPPFTPASDIRQSSLAGDFLEDTASTGTDMLMALVKTPEKQEMDKKPQEPSGATAAAEPHPRMSGENFAKVESMPELPDFDPVDAALYASEDVSSAPLVKHQRQKRKLNTYPMTAISDSEPSESEPLIERDAADEAEALMGELSQGTPSFSSKKFSKAGASSAGALDDETEPLAVVPRAQPAGVAAAGQTSPSTPSRSSLTDFMARIQRSFTFAGGVSKVSAASSMPSSSSTQHHQWSYLAERRMQESKSGRGGQNLESLEQKLADDLFRRQKLIPKTRPRSNSQQAATPKVQRAARFSLPSERSRLKGRSDGHRPRRVHQWESLRSSPSPSSAPSARETPTNAPSFSRLNAASFNSEPPSSLSGVHVVTERRASTPGFEAPTVIGKISRVCPSHVGSSMERPSASSSLPGCGGRAQHTVSPSSSMVFGRKRIPTSMEALRRKQEEELLKDVKEGKHVSFVCVEDTIDLAVSGTDSMTTNIDKAWLRLEPGIIIARTLSKASGIMPWNRRFKWTSLAYQFVVVLIVSANFMRSFSQVVMHYRGGREAVESTLQVVALVRKSYLSAVLDSMSSLGVLLGLLSLGVLRPRTAEATMTAGKVVQNYTVRNGLQHGWSVFTKRDHWATLAIFIVLIALRLWVAFVEDDSFVCMLLEVTSFSVAAFVNLGLVGYILHVCRGLITIIDAYCNNVADHPDFKTAVREWGLIQAMCRSVSSAMQSCFVVLLFQALMMAVVIMMDISNKHSLSPLLAPAFVLSLAILRISWLAAEVTDKCLRVPLLVNSLSVGTDLDLNRMYTVDYIVHAQAGYYVGEMRLTCSTLMKAVYVACVVTVGVSTQLRQAP